MTTTRRKTKNGYTPLTPEQIAAGALAREEQRASRITSPATVNQVIATMVETYGLTIPGLESYSKTRVLEQITEAQSGALRDDCDWSLDWERGWGQGCSLSIRARRENWMHGTKYVFVTYTPKIELNWSSTRRSVSGAIASITLYRQVAEFAALVEARLAEIDEIGVARLLDAPTESSQPVE